MNLYQSFLLSGLAAMGFWGCASISWKSSTATSQWRLLASHEKPVQFFLWNASHTMALVQYPQEPPRLVRMVDAENKGKSYTDISLSEQPLPIREAYFSKNGRRLLTRMQGDSIVRVWDTKTGTNLFNLTDDAEDVRAVLFAEEGESVFSAGDSGVIRWWDASGKLKKEFVHGTREVVALGLSTDGKHLISGDGEGGIVIWNVESGGENVRTKAHFTESAQFAIAVSPDGFHFATVTDSDVIRIWDLEGNCERALENKSLRSNNPHPLAFSSDGNDIFVEQANGEIQTWDWREDKKKFHFDKMDPDASAVVADFQTFPDHLLRKQNQQLVVLNLVQGKSVMAQPYVQTLIAGGFYRGPRTWAMRTKPYAWAVSPQGSVDSWTLLANK